MLKKALATAVAAATLFACSSDDDGDDNNKKAPPSSTSISSSSEQQQTTGSSSSETGTSSSSSGPVAGGYELLYDFAEESDYTVGYTYGDATLENECVAPEEGEAECSILDAEGKPLRSWVQDGIFTLKNFSYNGKQTDEAGGGLMIKNLTVKDYASVKFDIRSTATGNHGFRVKVEKEVNGELKGAALQKSLDIVAGTTHTIEVEMKSGFSTNYNNTDIPNTEISAYIWENATEVEFIIPPARFATSDTKHTLEIDNFSVKKK
jgi:hypothetical protein